MKSISERISEKPMLGWILFFITVIIVALLAFFASSIFERKNEAYYTMQMVRPIADDEARNEVWGENFP
ncbi:MAG: ammonia-forming cytochrome c nitrite reductase subunit c552, partial [Ignavibacteriae bacterium]|nr:ammonia-forming cytochrome c nitrite reductase subunit c552 [Ignavibacteriota bacterium]